VENVIGKICPRLFETCCYEIGGMLHRLRGMDTLVSPWLSKL